MATPDATAVVGWHRNIVKQPEAGTGRQGIDGFGIADRHVRAAYLQALIERSVAVTAVATFVIEWSVDDHLGIVSGDRG